MVARNRLLKLLDPAATFNGIDFVEVMESAPNELRVHFINTITLGNIGPIARIDGGDSVPVVAVADVLGTDWLSDGEGRPLLMLHCLDGGDFSDYTLHLAIDALDLDFKTSVFSFKVFCPSDFDCKPDPPRCPPDDTPLPAIDYLAKDFKSFRQALSDFSALRYPQWHERSEADFGVMFMEALSALADDLSYQQDRIAAEASLDTASEYRSVARHARLVDYPPRPATCARTWLVCAVAAGTTALPAGAGISAALPEGTSVPFEIGNGLTDTTLYPVDANWNQAIDAYWLDDSGRCLPSGAIEMWLEGVGYAFKEGQSLLIDTMAAVSADPPIRAIVHLVKVDDLNVVEETTDPLFPPGGTPITRIKWRASEALTHARDLTRTVVRGNVVPATQGRRCNESFAIGTAPSSAPSMPVAIERLGANSTPALPITDYLYCLASAPLGWLAGDDPDSPQTPEIRVSQPTVPVREWTFKPRLIEADESECVFCLEAASYRRIFRHADGAAQVEYDGDAGDTIRFGGGDFGVAPNDKDIFNLSYRVGAGALGNVAAGAIATVDPAWRGTITAVSNPFAATGGADRETNEQVRRRAPQAFRERQFRAVRAEDYQAEARRLAWVQQAGCAFRWTGSWFTVFTSIDPKGGETLPPERHTEAVELFNRRRLCGYESYVPPARYVSVDLDIKICARPDAFRGIVEREVLDALASADRRAAGFFFADHFTFGTPLERSRLEDAIQRVPGVAGVLGVRYRRRAVVPNYVDLVDPLTLGSDEILRVDNDPNHPERGSLQVTVMGGR